MIEIDKRFLDELLGRASLDARLRMNHDLRTSPADTSQRMLNALLPGTEVAIHRYPKSSENVILLKGRMDEVFYDDKGIEIGRISLCSAEGRYGCVVPPNVWHSVDVFEPTVIYEAKDGGYGQDGSETLGI